MTAAGPATTCHLPAHRAFLRWGAADSEAGTVLADSAVAWQECGTWETDRPTVLMDPAPAGGLLGVGTTADDRTSLGLVRLVPDVR
ncbi:Imm21 family immunity protein [Streptomyces sp. NPDC005722]